MMHKGVNLLWIVGGAALLAAAARANRASASDAPSLNDGPSDNGTKPAQFNADADAAAAAAKAAEMLDQERATKRTKKPTPHKPANHTKKKPTPPEPAKHTNEPTPAPPDPKRSSAAPDGYDPSKARSTAPKMAEHIKRRGSDYDRKILRAWQRAAALKADGIYGGGTRGALMHYGVPTPPRPLFKPTQTIPYTPPE